MSKQTKANKSGKSTKRSNRKSLRGVWGKVGAPPKPVNWPTTPFTYKVLFARNTGQCRLSLRNKCLAGVKDNIAAGGKNGTGSIFQLVSIPQPHGHVGRPKERYVLAGNFDAATMTLATDKVPSVRKSRVVTVTTVDALLVTPFNINTPATDNVPAVPIPVPMDPPPIVVEVPIVPTIETPAVESAPQPQIA